MANGKSVSAGDVEICGLELIMRIIAAFVALIAPSHMSAGFGDLSTIAKRLTSGSLPEGTPNSSKRSTRWASCCGVMAMMI